MFSRRPTHSAQYRAHIASPEWDRIRAGALQRSGYSCDLCGRNRDALRRIGRHLQVHHKHYRNLGRERPEDLAVLCAGGRGGCHALADAQRRAANGTTRAPARKHRSRRGRRRRVSAPVRALLTPVGIFLTAAGGLKLCAIILPRV